MDHGDNLNRLPFPHVADDVGVEVPKSITAVEKLLVEMSNARGPSQPSKALENLGTQTFSRLGAVLSNVDKDFAKVGFRFLREKKPSLHERTAFFLARLCSSITSRSSSNTSSPSSNLLASACAAPRSIWL